MKAIVIEKYGSAEELILKDLPVPEPEKGEIRVRVRACGLNPVDFKIRQGHLEELFPVKFPWIPGGDVAGVVDKVGDDVSHLKQGDRVFFAAPLDKNGGYAEYCTVDAGSVVTIPSRLSFEEAATLPVAGLTSVQALRDFGQVKPGHKVLIHAGAGGVGTLAIQYAKALGAEVYTTASEGNAEYVRSLGADVVINYREQNFVEICQQAGGMDVVLESLGGLFYPESIKATKSGGRVPCIVNPPDSDTQGLAASSQITTDFLLLESRPADLEHLCSLVDSETIRPGIFEKISMNQIRDAHKKLESGRTKGKLILSIP